MSATVKWLRNQTDLHMKHKLKDEDENSIVQMSPNFCLLYCDINVQQVRNTWTS